MESEHKLVNDLMPDLVIEVASRVEAGDILGSPQRCAEVTYLISIGALNDELPIGYYNISSKVRLLFGDTLDAESGATEGDVRTLMEIAQNIRLFKGSSNPLRGWCEPIYGCGADPLRLLAWCRT